MSLDEPCTECEREREQQAIAAGEGGDMPSSDQGIVIRVPEGMDPETGCAKLTFIANIQLQKLYHISRWKQLCKS